MHSMHTYQDPSTTRISPSVPDETVPTAPTNTTNTTLQTPTILIVHAGGESSRCPTQMVLGKSWTTLPCRQRQNSQRHCETTHTHGDDSDHDTNVSIHTPTLCIVRKLQDCLLPNLPQGSVVVAASDTLLHLPFDTHIETTDNDTTTTTTTNTTTAMDWSQIYIHGQKQRMEDAHAVLGIAVPAPLTTAKNHGVHVLASSSTTTTRDCPDTVTDPIHPSITSAMTPATMTIQPIYEFLQKPSLQHMMECSNNDANNDVNGGAVVFPHPVTAEPSAWIDTGIVIFLPKAAAALRQLAQEEALKGCCWDGLYQMWNEENGKCNNNKHYYEINDNHHDDDHDETRTAPDTIIISSTTINDFAQEHAIKIDLYTHMMMALATTRSSETSSSSSSTVLADYLERHKNDLPEHVLTAIHQRLSPFQLQALLVPNGQFLHLGTSKELVEFLVEGTREYRHANDNDNGSAILSPNVLRSRLIARDMNLVFNYQSLLISSPSSSSSPLLSSATTTNDHDNHICCYNSFIHTCGTLQIGPGCVLEHIHVVVQHATVDIRIGDGCLISGWRGDYSSKPSSTLSISNGNDNGNSTIVIPSKTCLQMIPLAKSQDFVVMMFGLDDDMKDWRHIHGVDAGVFLEMTKMDDLWDSQDAKQTVWTAKLHPVVKEFDFAQLFAWVQELQETGAIVESTASLNLYKSHRRLSLEQIRRLSDAQKEWEYRHDLEHVVLPLHINLLKRRHVECRMELNVRTLAALSDVCHTALVTGMYDVSGRAFMVASAMFADHHQYRDSDSDELPDLLETILDNLLNHPKDRIHACNALFEECKACFICKTGLSTASLALERAASIMTEQCVRGTCHRPSFERTAAAATVPAVGAAHNWILATAPARVDLSGGWSDTPPICFEYGGAVTGLAVTVDGMKPLSCRCRIIPGGQDIRVCTESRDAVSGELLSHATAILSTVSDLDDCRNPHADCALIKCSLVYLGLLPDGAEPSHDLQPFLRRFCCLDHQVGLEIVSTSLLPRGSGMGTSSILAGCVLASLVRCVGIDLDENDDERLISLVLQLEQLLTCGGGWQDQIGGLFGGLKLGTSKPYEFPVIAHVHSTPLKRSTITKLNERLILVFSGQTRFAKNILQKVLHRWARRTSEIVNTVQALVRDAHRANRALVEEDFDTLADCLNNYWNLKKTMAGGGGGVDDDDCGVEPPVVRQVLEELFRHKEIVAGSLCGAGGGGFLVLLTSEGRTMDQVKATFDQKILCLYKDAADFTWHKCQVSEQGLTTRVLPLTEHAFDIAWHS